jgi:Trypsin-like peptidase domain
MNWDDAVNEIKPHVVKIETPRGHGTGFLSFYNQSGFWCGIATAAHVVDRADEWQELIKIWHEPSGRPILFKEEERVIFLDHVNDSAVILIPRSGLQLPEVPIGMLPVEETCRIGSDIGWLGYPAMAPYSLCFFAGTVSTRQDYRKSYLIDGVAIHGVSGGPVFHCPAPSRLMTIGCVSAYQANRVAGEALPGLLRAQDVSHFHEVAGHVRSRDEALAAKRQLEEEQKQKAQPTAVPTEPPNLMPPPPSIDDGAASNRIN